MSLLSVQLLEYGAAVDAVDAMKGRTALHRAIKGSVMMYPMDAKIVTLLLDSGASPFCADKKGESCMRQHMLCFAVLCCAVLCCCCCKMY